MEKHDNWIEINKKLEEEINHLKALQVDEKIKSVNRQTNKPSSKQAEWELKGVGNDGINKKKGRGKKGRKGAGNKPKNKTVTKEEIVKVDSCRECSNNCVCTDNIYLTV